MVFPRQLIVVPARRSTTIRREADQQEKVGGGLRWANLKWFTREVGGKEERTSSKCMRIQSLSAQIKSQSSLAGEACHISFEPPPQAQKLPLETGFPSEVDGAVVEGWGDGAVMWGRAAWGHTVR